MAGSSWSDYRKDKKKKRLEEERDKLLREEESGMGEEVQIANRPRETSQTRSEKTEAESSGRETSESASVTDKGAGQSSGGGPSSQGESKGIEDAPLVSPSQNQTGTGSAKPEPQRQDQEGPVPFTPNRQDGQGGAYQTSAKKKKKASKAKAKAKNKAEKPVSKPKSQPAPKPSKPPLSPRALRRRRKMLGRIALIAVLLAVACFSVQYFLTRRTYHAFKVIQTSEQEDIVSTRYTQMAGKILRYSQDGVSLVNRSLQPQWSSTYTMTTPIADVRGSHAVIADQDGTTLVMVGENGVTGTATTAYRIVKACVSNNGLVAAILDGGGETWINFYSTDGSLIAENQTTLEDPGYPLDVALSDNGVIMMVTYQFIDGSNTTSYVAFYNFGDVGQNSDDRIVSGYTYEGVVIPQIQYLDGSHSVAFRDDGFSLYSGGQIPAEAGKVEVEKEIVSTFYDDDHIGLVFKNDSKDALYTMEVYDTDGELKFTRDFNVPYTTIKMSGGYILMYNSAQLCVISGDGVQRFLGTVDGSINDCVKIGLNRYVLVLDTGVNIIKFS